MYGYVFDAAVVAGVEDALPRSVLLLFLHQPHLLQQMDPHGELRAPRYASKEPSPINAHQHVDVYSPC